MKLGKHLFVAIAVVLLVGGIALAGKTIYVDDVTDPQEDGTEAHPFDAIQEGIDAASNGDIVVVKDGIYTGDGNRDIDFRGKAIILMSENGPENCVIDCEGTEEEPHRGLYFHSGEDDTSILDGFTITNGLAEHGGGIYCYESSPMIANNTIIANTGFCGGGINCYGASPVITGNTIVGNTASLGGAISLDYGFSPTITNSTVAENSALLGGGVFSEGRPDHASRFLITNCIIWGNTAPVGPQFRLLNNSTMAISFSDIAGGQGGWDSVLTWGDGNIDADPLFADPDNGDYHLKSAGGRWDPAVEEWVADGTHSPCIDAGDTAGDYSNEPEPNGGRINMGAYGGTATASKSPPEYLPVDLLIKADSENNAAYAQNDVYYPAPAGEQIETQTVRDGGAAVYQIKVENDSPVDWSFFVRGGKGSDAGWSVGYLVGPKSITSAITGPDGYVTGLLAPGESQVITLVMTPTNYAAVGTSESVTVEVFQDSTDPTVRDSVEAVAEKLMPLYGDVNGDNCVNVMDLLGVRAHLGQGSGCP